MLYEEEFISNQILCFLAFCIWCLILYFIAYKQKSADSGYKDWIEIKKHNPKK